MLPLPITQSLLAALSTASHSLALLFAAHRRLPSIPPLS
mgnify:CR=1 FL=1